MRLSTLIPAALLALTPFAAAERLLQSKSLASCQKNSSFSATLFDVLFTPDDGQLDFNITGVSTVEGNVTIELAAFAYGLSIYRTSLDPCDLGFAGLCPMQAAPINLKSNLAVPKSALKEIPGESWEIHEV